MYREVSNLQRAILQEKRRLEETLVKLRETQAMLIHSAKMNALGQLVAGVAHEINNPLGFVSGNLHTLNDFLADLKDGFQALRSLVDEAGPAALQARAAEIQQRHDIDFIVHEFADVHRACVDGVGRVKRIVEDLRTFSRLDEAELKTVDLAESLDSTLTLMRPELKRRQIEVQVVLEQLPPVTCFASELNQVFLNLVLNAVQAMEPGGSLQIRGHGEGESIRLDFTDNGQGIPPEIQGKIFDPFFTTKPVGQGTGLGLSLAYQIVTERHHGTIHVVSEVNRGTTISLSLPTQARPG
jgi:signal transduction histidine kinase